MTTSHDVHVIAEAGTNHGGSTDTAIRLIDIAVDAGADSVKFQIIHPDGLYLRDLWVDGKLVHNEVFDLREAAMLPDAAWADLAAHARDRDIGFGASVFDERGLDILDAVETDYVKIASCDLNNGPLLRRAAARGRRLIVASGMSTYAEIQVAMETLADHADVVLLHCVSVYPCPTADTNMGFLPRLRDFGRPYGFSDHTENSVAAAMSIALGGTWIEKHVTFDRAAAGFDHAYAMEPSMFASYVADVRAAATAIAGVRDPSPPAEALVRQRARRALWAATDLPAGTILRGEHVAVVRPEGPMEPNDLPALIGRRLRVSLRTAEPFTEEDLDPEPG